MITIKRIQTGVRLEKRTVKVLKGLAEHLDISLGELLEGMAWHAFDGRQAFGPETLKTIAGLREVYGLTLTASDSHGVAEVERDA